MNVDAGALAPELEQLLRAKQYEQLLDKAAGFVVAVNNELIGEISKDPSTARGALFIPTLDSILHSTGIALANSTAANQARHGESNVVFHVATELYAVGGHTRVIVDIIQALPEYRHCIVMTDLFGRIAQGDLPIADVEWLFRGTETRLLTLKPDSLVGRVRQLMGLLSENTPCACFLYHHHMDAVATVAISAATCRCNILVHHADHLPSLGATRRDYLHADVTLACYRECLASAGNFPVFIGLTAEDHGVKLRASHSGAGLNAASVGPPRKYWPDGVGIRYVDLVREIMRAAGGLYYHIGGVPADSFAQIRTELASIGIDPERFIDVGRVRSVWNTLVELDADFFVDSFPFGGVGKTFVEALGAGLPLLLPATLENPSLYYVDMSMGAGAYWRDLGDIASAVDTIRSNGEQLAARSRNAYETYYSQIIFREKVRNLVHGEPPR